VTPEAASQAQHPPVTDKRFSSAHWEASPLYDYLRRAYLLNADYLSKMVEHVALPDETQRNHLRLMTRQFIDAMAPSNFAATNPDVIKKAVETKGESLRAGILNLLADLEQGSISSTDASAFEIGRNLATTPGEVIYENDIFQLIQYAPLTDKVAQRPLLIVPPCINKFYILDLQAHNSFVRYAVEQGFTVFLMSWRNVKEAQGALGWDDYLDDGILNAIDIVRDVCKVKQINVLGFCVGGTMLTSALAVAKARGESPAASLTLLTSLLDFSTPGDRKSVV
jgi:polyhydroxyalkanoate synthase